MRNYEYENTIFASTHANNILTYVHRYINGIHNCETYKANFRPISMGAS